MNSTESNDRRPTLTTADVAASAQRREQREQRMDEAESRLQPGTDANPQTAEAAALFDADNAREFRSQWGVVQQGFVDDPAKAVRQGDELVAQVIKNLAETFAQQRKSLEGKQGSTEDLRLALRRYRSFFDRLLSV